MWNYSEKVMDHFLNPRNAGEIPDADAVGQVGNVVCGDALKVMLKINPQTNTQIRIKSVSAKGNFMQVQVAPGKK